MEDSNPLEEKVNILANEINKKIKAEISEDIEENEFGKETKEWIKKCIIDGGVPQFTSVEDMQTLMSKCWGGSIPTVLWSNISKKDYEWFMNNSDIGNYDYFLKKYSHLFNEKEIENLLRLGKLNLINHFLNYESFKKNANELKEKIDEIENAVTKTTISKPLEKENVDKTLSKASDILGKLTEQIQSGVITHVGKQVGKRAVKIIPKLFSVVI